jgi:hypothetical protein
MTKTNLNNIFPRMQLYRGYQKEIFNRKRVTIPKKYQEIDIFTPKKKKINRSTHKE